MSSLPPSYCMLNGMVGNPPAPGMFRVTKRQRNLIWKNFGKRKVILSLAERDQKTGKPLKPKLVLSRAISSEARLPFWIQLRKQAKAGRVPSGQPRFGWKAPEPGKMRWEPALYTPQEGGKPRPVRVKGQVAYEIWMVPSVMRTVSFLSECEKMSCASWSLPAGHPSQHGSCPAAAMSVLKHEQPKIHANLMKVMRSTAKASGRRLGIVQPTKEETELAEGESNFICDYCYAGKNNYIYERNQLYQMLRLRWQTNAMKGKVPVIMPDGSRRELGFVDAMVRAISHYANVASSKTGRSQSHRKNLYGGFYERDDNPNYFRIHDSGDFLGLREIAAWAEVCVRLPWISFWAPTRVHALGTKYTNALRKASKKAKNLVIRASALTFAEDAPQVPGLPAGSAVSMTEAGTWQCKAYRAIDPLTGKDHHTCSVSENPFGGIGCRMCWGGPNVEADPYELVETGGGPVPAGELKHNLLMKAVSYHEH